MPRCKTVEIRWHDTTPIYSIDFQPFRADHFRRLLNASIPSSAGGPSNSTSTAAGASQLIKEGGLIGGGRHYRLATGGGDNNVRVWAVHPNIPPPQALEPGVEAPTPPPPRIEYLSTLSKHTSAVNVVRWDPKGELLATAGDDGFVVLWAQSTLGSATASGATGSLSSTAFGLDDGASGGDGEDKEHWRVRTIFRVSQDPVYDLAWSPDGAYLIAGCMDNTARVYDREGAKIHEIADHTHFVQGVSWDPLGEYVATQSSDRTVHIYRLKTSPTAPHNPIFHPHSQSQKMEVYHSRLPSFSSFEKARPRLGRRPSSVAGSSDAGTGPFDSASEIGDEGSVNVPLTPTSLSATANSTAAPGGVPPIEGVMKPPKPPSRRSSFSSSVPSPRMGRSPSPLPAPAIRPSSSTTGPDVLLANVPGPVSGTSSTSGVAKNVGLYGDENFSRFFRRLAFSPDGGLLLTPAGQIDDSIAFPPSTPSTSTDKIPAEQSDKPEKSGGQKPTVFIYNRANLNGKPIAHLPGHKSVSIAVKFSPIFYELRDDGFVASGGPVKIKLEKKDEVKEVSIIPPRPTTSGESPIPEASSPLGVFNLPYRLFYAVATQDAVMLYDTQQPSPVAIFMNLHYAGFSDLAWSPDGHSLMLSSVDGYCSIIVFNALELGVPQREQQHERQLHALVDRTHSGGSTTSGSVPASPALGHSASASQSGSVMGGASPNLSAPSPVVAVNTLVAKRSMSESTMFMPGAETTATGMGEEGAKTVVNTLMPKMKKRKVEKAELISTAPLDGSSVASAPSSIDGAA